MERLFDAEYADGRPKAPATRKGSNRGIAVMRYADDFVITAPTREVLETYARPRAEKFLEERGLALSEAKTRIVHIKEGFNFLGFHIRTYGSPIFKAVQQKQCKASYTTLRRSPRGPECAVGEGSEHSDAPTSVGAPLIIVSVISLKASNRRSAVGRAVSRFALPA